jgi:hypothetical protein
LPVGLRCCAAGFDRHDVVAVADGRVAPRRTARLVSEHEELGETGVEHSAAGVHRDQLTGLRAGEEPADPGLGAVGRGQDEAAGQLGGDRSAAFHRGGFGAAGAVEERAVGHHQVDRHRHRSG